MVSQQQKDFPVRLVFSHEGFRLARFGAPPLGLGATCFSARIRSNVATSPYRCFALPVCRFGRTVVHCCAFTRFVARERPLTSDKGMGRKTPEFLRNLPRRKDEVHTPRLDGTMRHRLVLRRIVLRERDSAFCLDGLESERSVAPRAGQHNTDRALVLRKRQRLEE